VVGAVVLLLVAPAILLHAMEVLSLDERIVSALDAPVVLTQGAGRTFLDRLGMGSIALGVGVGSLVLLARGTLVRGLAALVAAVAALALAAFAARFAFASMELPPTALSELDPMFRRMIAYRGLQIALLSLSVTAVVLRVAPLSFRGALWLRVIALALWMLTAAALIFVTGYTALVTRAAWGVYFVGSAHEVLRHLTVLADVVAFVAVAVGCVIPDRASEVRDGAKR
jgi:hypothetical protein